MKRRRRADACIMAADPAMLDQQMIEQLRESLTPEMRSQLLDAFHGQVDECLGQLADAVRRSDRDERRRVAHLLKGSSATMGASRLRSLCEQLEGRGSAGSLEPGEEQLEELRKVATEALQAVDQALA
jgi:HPt (histidine-containing phosphotransfer) domain-containing protein